MSQFTAVHLHYSNGGKMLGCTNLGVCYAIGNGVGQDASKAAALFQKACDGGEMGGCYNLGNSYARGDGVGQDATKAAALFQKACNGGEMLGCNKAR